MVRARPSVGCVRCVRRVGLIGCGSLQEIVLDIADEGNIDGCVLHVIPSRDDGDGMKGLTEEKLVDELEPILNVRCASCIVCSCIATHAYAGSAHGSTKKYI